MTDPAPRDRPDRRRGVSVLLAVALLVTAAACTGADEEPVSLPERSVGSAATLEAKPVPLDVRVEQTIGPRLKPAERRQLRDNVGRVVSDYLDAAYFGEYPRASFGAAFDRFSRGAARRARSDRSILTNAAVGREIESVTPRKKQLRLFVLRDRRGTPGLTARIRVVFLEDRAEGPDRRVLVTGRLLVDRADDGRWQVFGYDLSRSDVPAGKGGQ